MFVYNPYLLILQQRQQAVCIFSWKVRNQIVNNDCAWRRKVSFQRLNVKGHEHSPSFFFTHIVSVITSRDVTKEGDVLNRF